MRSASALPRSSAAQVRPTRVARTVFFYPYIISALIIGFLWSALLAPQGVVNSLLAQAGLGSIPFLTDPMFAKAAVIFTVVWSHFGFNMILYIAGLKSIPAEYYEAATVDGASRWVRFRHITLPLLAPIVTVNVVLSLVGFLKVYDIVLALTDGGPAASTQTIVYQILMDSFQNAKLGLRRRPVGHPPDRHRDPRPRRDPLPSRSREEGERVMSTTDSDRGPHDRRPPARCRPARPVLAPARAPREDHHRSRSPSPARLFKWLILALVAVVMLVPLYIMVISAFKPANDILLNPLGFSPDSFTFDYLVQGGDERTIQRDRRVRHHPPVRAARQPLLHPARRARRRT